MVCFVDGPPDSSVHPGPGSIAPNNQLLYNTTTKGPYLCYPLEATSQMRGVGATPSNWSPPSRSMRTLHYNSGMLHIVGVPLIILASIGVGFMTVSCLFVLPRI